MTNYILRRAHKDQSSVQALSELSLEDLKVWRSNENWPADLHNGWVFRWGCQSFILPLERVVNVHNALVFASNKRDSRKVFADAGLAPETWLNVLELPADGGPYIVRPSHHAQGENLHFVPTNWAANEAAYLCGENYYISKYIDKKAEYRVFVSQGRVVWIANKIPGNPEDVAWNHELGGHFENMNWNKWPSEACRAAISAMELSRLDFGGVDIMRGSDDKMYVLEINTACTLNSGYRRACAAKAFDYIISKGSKETIPVGPNQKGYLSYIHPAVCEGALL